MLSKIIYAFIFFALPSKAIVLILRLKGFKISYASKFGFSIILVNKFHFEGNVVVKHFNLIKVNSIALYNGSNIGFANIIKGPIEIILKENAAIGKLNQINRMPLGVTYGISELTIGRLSKITANHYIDCTKSIHIGDYSIIAGLGSQLWTHGYYHYPTGDERFRIDGKICIGNNVYIGSKVVINPNVNIANSISVGSGSSISKSLDKSGLYVSQPLRYIEQTAESVLSKLEKVTNENLVEKVFTKK